MSEELTKPWRSESGERSAAHQGSEEPIPSDVAKDS